MADYRFGPFLYEGATGRLYRDGSDVALAPRVAGLLEHLLGRAGEVCPKEELLHEVWEGTSVSEESLTQAVSVLRAALGDDPKRPRWLETIQRRGYRFIGAVEIISPQPTVPEPVATRAVPVLSWLTGAGLILVFAALAWPESPSEPVAGAVAPPIRFTIDLGDAPLAHSHNEVLALSPDGSRLAMVRPNGIYLRELDAETIALIYGTARGKMPAFSPDGRELMFHAGASLERLSLAGGVPEPVATARGPRGAHWSDRGFFYGQLSQGIFRYDPASGATERVVALDTGEKARDPQLLPGGEWLVYSFDGGVGNWDDAEIVAQHLPSGERRTLAFGSAVRYLPTGHLVFARRGGLWAVAFDGDEVRVAGDPVLMIEELVQAPDYGAAQYTVSDTGILTYLQGALVDNAARRLKWVAEGGAETVIDTRSIDNPRLSPDERFVVAVGPANNDAAVWVHELGRGWTLLTPDAHGVNPIWGPDGRTVYFESVRDGSSAIWRRSIDFNGPAERLWGPPVDRVSAPESMTADGRYLYFTALEGGDVDIWVLDLAGDAAAPTASPVEGLSTSGADEGSAMVHPSGELLAYVSDESGLPEVYVRELVAPATGGRRWKISGPAGGDEPRWSRDGAVLYYRVEDALIAVDVRVDPSFRVAGSRPYIEELVAEAPRSRVEYDVAADGRILISGPAGVDWPSYARVHVVVNWFSELVERVPPPDRN